MSTYRIQFIKEECFYKTADQASIAGIVNGTIGFALKRPAPII